MDAQKKTQLAEELSSVYYCLLPDYHQVRETMRYGIDTFDDIAISDFLSEMKVLWFSDFTRKTALELLADPKVRVMLERREAGFGTEQDYAEETAIFPEWRLLACFSEDLQCLINGLEDSLDNSMQDWSFDQLMAGSFDDRLKFFQDYFGKLTDYLRLFPTSVVEQYADRPEVVKIAQTCIKAFDEMEAAASIECFDYKTHRDDWEAKVNVDGFEDFAVGADESREALEAEWRFRHIVRDMTHRMCMSLEEAIEPVIASLHDIPDVAKELLWIREDQERRYGY